MRMGVLLAWKSVRCSWAVPVDAMALELQMVVSCRSGGWESDPGALEEHQELWTCDLPSLYPPNTSQRSTISKHPSIVGWNFNMNFRGGKLCSKHSSSSLYGLACHVTLILFTEWAQEAPHLFAQESLSPLPSPRRPHIESCRQKLVGRIRSSLSTRVECLRWYSAEIKTVII